MRIFIHSLIISVFAVQRSYSNCEGSRELEEQCASYCFKAVRPFMDYVKVLQKKVNEADEPIAQGFDSRFDHLDSFMAKQNSNTLAKLDSIEKKLNEVLPKDSPIEKFEKIGSKYYYIENYKKVNWFVAADICRTMGAHLVSFQNSYEFDAVIESLKHKIDYWIDLNDLGTEGQFRSVVTGFEPAYVNWHDGEPNNGRRGEHCCELWYIAGKHLMNDATCSDVSRFICEYASK